MMNKSFKIGIIGPRSFGLGGHDLNNSIRSKVIKKMDEIIKRIKQEKEYVVGLTGLDIGTEQDFARLCLLNGIVYYYYIPYTNVKDIWGNIPQAQENYDTLVSKALHKFPIGNGNYSPKKVFLKNKRIIDDSDLIIYVSNPLHNEIPECMNYMNQLGKNCILIDTNELQTIF